MTSEVLPAQNNKNNNNTHTSDSLIPYIGGFRIAPIRFPHVCSLDNFVSYR